MSLAPPDGILWLDLSTNVGWVYGDRSMIETGPIWGVWKLPSVTVGIGKLFASYENELYAAIKQFRPSVIGMEAPLPAGQQNNAETAEILIGLAAITECAAYRCERPLYRRASSTVRGAVLGRFRRTEDERRDRISIKDAIVKPWCEARGWNIGDNNARDAAVGWAYEFGIRARRSAA